MSSTPMPYRHWRWIKKSCSRASVGNKRSSLVTATNSASFVRIFWEDFRSSSNKFAQASVLNPKVTKRSKQKRQMETRKCDEKFHRRRRRGAWRGCVRFLEVSLKTESNNLQAKKILSLNNVLDFFTLKTRHPLWCVYPDYLAANTVSEFQIRGKS